MDVLNRAVKIRGVTTRWYCRGAGHREKVEKEKEKGFDGKWMKTSGGGGEERGGGVDVFKMDKKQESHFLNSHVLFLMCMVSVSVNTTS